VAAAEHKRIVCQSDTWVAVDDVKSADSCDQKTHPVCSSLRKRSYRRAGQSAATTALVNDDVLTWQRRQTSVNNNNNNIIVIIFYFYRGHLQQSQSHSYPVQHAHSNLTNVDNSKSLTLTVDIGNHTYSGHKCPEASWSNTPRAIYHTHSSSTNLPHSQPSHNTSTDLPIPSNLRGTRTSSLDAPIIFPRLWLLKRKNLYQIWLELGSASGLRFLRKG